MEVEISVPQTPVTLAPGEPTRVRVELCNRSAVATSLRVGVARSRSGSWASAEPETVDLLPGGTSSVDVVFRPPADVLPTPTLLPFTVQAEDLRFGVIAGRATGLLTVAAPDRLTATLTPEPDGHRGARYAVALENRGGSPVTVRLLARIDPAGAVQAEPPVIDVPGDGSATAHLRARPKVHLVGRPSSYAVSVTCQDAAAEPGGEPLATAAATGTARPRVEPRIAVLTGTAVAIALTTASVTFGVLSLANRRPPGPVPTQAATEAVRHPYALVDAFPQQDEPAGRAAADAALNRFTKAGMRVRIVDSSATADAGGAQVGRFWVLVHDGFPSVDAVRAYCDQYRPVAPKCQAMP